MFDIQTTGDGAYHQREETHGLVDVIVSWPRGWGDEHHHGATWLATQHFGNATERLSRPQLQARLIALSASVRTAASRERTRVIVSCHRDRLEPTLDLAREMILEPSWDSSEHERLRAIADAHDEAATESPEELASLAMARSLYPDHRLGWPVRGVEPRRRETGCEQARARWAAITSAKPLLLACGLESDHHVALTTEFLRALRPDDVGLHPTAESAPAARSGSRVYVPRGGATDVLHIAVPLPPQPARRDAALRLVNFALTGGFMGSLYDALRTRENLVYSVSSHVVRGRDEWLWVLEATPDSGRTSRVQRAIRDELCHNGGPFAGADDFEAARERFLLNDVHRTSTWRRRLGATLDALERGRPTREAESLAGHVRSLTLDSVGDLTESFSFASEPRNIVHVGGDVERTGIWTRRSVSDVVGEH